MPPFYQLEEYLVNTTHTSTWAQRFLRNNPGSSSQVLSTSHHTKWHTLCYLLDNKAGCHAHRTRVKVCGTFCIGNKLHESLHHKLELLPLLKPCHSRHTWDQTQHGSRRYSTIVRRGQFGWVDSQGFCCILRNKNARNGMCCLQTLRQILPAPCRSHICGRMKKMTAQSYETEPRIRLHSYSKAKQKNVISR